MVIHQWIRNLKRGHEMLRKDRWTDRLMDRLTDGRSAFL